MKLKYLNLFSLCILSACASVDHFKPTSVPSDLYTCDGARQITISIGDMAQEALIQFQGSNIPLKRTDSNSGIAFTNNIYTLFYNDGLAVLEREGVPILTNCRNR